MKLIKSLENKCLQYDISREQRKHEIEAGLGIEGSFGYEKVGCYECDGLKTECPHFYIGFERRKQ